MARGFHRIWVAGSSAWALLLAISFQSDLEEAVLAIVIERSVTEAWAEALPFVELLWTVPAGLAVVLYVAFWIIEGFRDTQ